MIDFSQPWPWYIAGPLIGMIVPVLLIIGNKSFGISSSLRHICAMCIPAKIPFFSYNWRKELWNIFFVIGIILGAFITAKFFMQTNTVINENLRAELATYEISNISILLPEQIFSWEGLFTLRGFLIIVVGGFFVGFGTRYAGGCTSGHSIMGLSTMQWPSLIATCCFMIGGFIMANLILPIILNL